MNDMIKKADILLGIFLVLLCGSSLFLLHLADGSGTLVTVTAGGAPYGTYDLAKDQTIEIDQEDKDHHNIIRIEKGAVFMTESNCANQLCVQQGKIRRTNQTIVCLPHKVVVTISGGSSGMDAISY